MRNFNEVINDKMKGFYKMDVDLLNTIDLTKSTDRDLAILNTYIMQKENLQRLKGNLPLGQFEMSTKSASIGTGFTLSKVKRLMDRMIKMNVITVVYKSNQRGVASVYQYTAISPCPKNSEPKNKSNMNKFDTSDCNASECNSEHINNSNDELFIKELENSSSCIIGDEQTITVDNVDKLKDTDLTLKARLDVLKNYGLNFKLNSGQQLLIKKYEIEVFIKAVESFVASGRDSFAYFFGILRNTVIKPVVDKVKTTVEKTGTCNTKKEVAKTNNKKETVKANKDYKKTKFHNFDETFTQYQEDEFEDIISKSQDAKFGNNATKVIKDAKNLIQQAIDILQETTIMTVRYDSYWKDKIDAKVQELSFVGL